MRKNKKGCSWFFIKDKKGESRFFIKDKKGESRFFIKDKKGTKFLMEHLFDILLWVIVFAIGFIAVVLILKKVNLF